MSRKSDKVRHILALSGGKDSAALAVYLKDKIPELEYVFLDTGHELPETYEFLQRMRAILGIKIRELKPKKNFDYWLKIFNGCLPSPQNRWCTKLLKIIPYEDYIGNDIARSYIALRADENRTGYLSHNYNIIPYYPFIEDGLIRSDIFQLLDQSGLGLPKYYSWRSRSGCYFCFFQRRIEWIGLYENHNDLFLRASKYESNHSDGRTYTWIAGKNLYKLLEDRERIIREGTTRQNTGSQASESKRLHNRLAATTFGVGKGSILGDISKNLVFADDNEDESSKPCLICTH